TIPANLLAEPLVPLIMLTSTLSALGGCVSESLGGLLGELSRPPLSGLIAVSRFAAHTPGATFGSRFGPWTGAAFYAAAALIAFLTTRLKLGALPARPPLQLGPAYAALTLGVVALISWWSLLKPSDHRLHLTFLDLGQSEAVLVTAPSGYRVLINGGSSGA